jgi:hypothetical protein
MTTSSRTCTAAAFPCHQKSPAEEEKGFHLVARHSIQLNDGNDDDEKQYARHEEEEKKELVSL